MYLSKYLVNARAHTHTHTHTHIWFDCSEGNALLRDSNKEFNLPTIFFKNESSIVLMRNCYHPLTK